MLNTSLPNQQTRYVITLNLYFSQYSPSPVFFKQTHYTIIVLLKLELYVVMQFKDFLYCHY